MKIIIESDKAREIDNKVKIIDRINKHKHRKASCILAEYITPMQKKEHKYITDYNIRYWINGGGTDGAYGWFTVEQLDQWLSIDSRYCPLNSFKGKI